jgi:hypothetical protein
MCRPMDDSDNMLAASHAQHKELMKEVHQLVSAIKDIKDTADTTVRDTGILKPWWKRGINWYGVSILLVNSLIALGLWWVAMWLDVNYVTNKANAAAWASSGARSEQAAKQQSDINIKILQQLQDLSTTVALTDQAGKVRDERLARLEEDIKEQRRMLMKR